MPFHMQLLADFAHIYVPTKILWFWMSPSLGNTAGFLYATVGGRFCLQGRHLAVVTLHKHWWLDKCMNTATHFFGSLVWLCSRSRFCTFMEMKTNSHSLVSLYDFMQWGVLNLPLPHHSCALQAVSGEPFACPLQAFQTREKRGMLGVVS